MKTLPPSERGRIITEGIMDRGFGTVYKATCKSRGGLVAIKMTKSDSKDDTMRHDAELLKKCTNECIVTFYDVIQHEEKLWVGEVISNHM